MTLLFQESACCTSPAQQLLQRLVDAEDLSLVQEWLATCCHPCPGNMDLPAACMIFPQAGASIDQPPPVIEY